MPNSKYLGKVYRNQLLDIIVVVFTYFQAAK